MFYFFVRRFGLSSNHTTILNVVGPATTTPSHDCQICGRSCDDLTALKVSTSVFPACLDSRRKFLRRVSNLRSVVVVLVERGETKSLLDDCKMSPFCAGICRQKHLVSHTEVRPYICEHCDAGFTTQTALNLHLNTHVQVGQYNFVLVYR